MTSPRQPLHQPHAAHAVAVWSAAKLLHEVTGYRRRVDTMLGELTGAHAAVLEACGRSFIDLPPAVAQCVVQLADAVDRATGRRAST
jgi:hypothetical protein